MARVRQRRYVVGPAIGAVLLLVAVSGCDWLQQGFSGGSDFANPSEPALTASTVGSLAPRFTVPQSAYGSPIIANGTLYKSGTTAGQGVSAYSATDGTLRWATTLQSAVSGGPIASNSDMVFTYGVASSGASTLYALDAGTGVTRWTDDIANLAGAPTIDGGKLFVMTNGGASSIIAIDPSTGSVLWSDNLPGCCAWGLWASDGHVSVMYNVANQWVLTAYNEVDGSPVFTTPTAGAAAANGRIYNIGWDGQHYLLQAIDPGTGDIFWSEVSPLGDIFNAAVSTSSIVFLGPGVEALDVTTGETQWTSPGGGFKVSNPVIAGGLAYIVSMDITGSLALLAYDLTTGAQVAAIPVGAAPIGCCGKQGPPAPNPPIVAEGHVYISNNGTITAYAPTP